MKFKKKKKKKKKRIIRSNLTRISILYNVVRLDFGTNKNQVQLFKKAYQSKRQSKMIIKFNTLKNIGRI